MCQYRERNEIAAVRGAAGVLEFRAEGHNLLDRVLDEGSGMFWRFPFKRMMARGLAPTPKT